MVAKSMNYTIWLQIKQTYKLNLKIKSTKPSSTTPPCSPKKQISNYVEIKRRGTTVATGNLTQGQGI
jgi:hypothetical protein